MYLDTHLCVQGLIGIASHFLTHLDHNCDAISAEFSAIDHDNYNHTQTSTLLYGHFPPMMCMAIV